MFKEVYKAAENGNVKVLKKYVKYTNKEQKYDNVTKNTPLMIAAQNGHEECVKILLGLNAGDYRDSDGMTALMLAAQNNHLNCVKILEKSEAKMINFKGETALMIAAKLDNYNIVERLAKLESKMKNNNDITALMIASNSNSINSVKILMQTEAKGQDIDGWTALFYAAEKDNDEIVNLLVKEEARIVAFNGSTALMKAAEMKSLKAVSILKNYEIGIQNDNGLTALMYAAYSQSQECIKELLSSVQSEINFISKTGRTALMYAAETGSIVCCKLLVEHESVSQIDKLNDSAVSIAKKHGHTHCKEFLMLYQKLKCVCGDIIYRKDIDVHLELPKHQKIICLCGLEIDEWEYESHLKSHKNHNIIHCTCGEDIENYLLGNHFKKSEKHISGINEDVGNSYKNEDMDENIYDENQNNKYEKDLNIDDDNKEGAEKIISNNINENKSGISVYEVSFENNEGKIGEYENENEKKTENGISGRSLVIKPLNMTVNSVIRPQSIFKPSKYTKNYNKEQKIKELPPILIKCKQTEKKLCNNLPSLKEFSNCLSDSNCTKRNSGSNNNNNLGKNEKEIGNYQMLKSKNKPYSSDGTYRSLSLMIPGDLVRCSKSLVSSSNDLLAKSKKNENRQVIFNENKKKTFNLNSHNTYGSGLRNEKKECLFSSDNYNRCEADTKKDQICDLSYIICENCGEKVSKLSIEKHDCNWLLFEHQLMNEDVELLIK